jgi:hypothetical protein
MSKATDYVKALQVKIDQPRLEITRPCIICKVSSRGEMLVGRGLNNETLLRLTAEDAVMLANWIYETFLDHDRDQEISNEF